MIPILDLKAQYESIKDEIDAAIAEGWRARSSSWGRPFGNWNRRWLPIADANMGWV
jgi:hypothetical protein